MKITGIERISNADTPTGGTDLRAPFAFDVRTPSGADVLEVSFEAASQLLVELSRAINARGITLGEPRP